MKDYAQHEEQYWRPGSSPGSISGSKVGWLLVGIGIGAGVALLLTPINGRELRGAIAHGCRRALNGIGSGISRGTQELREHGSNRLNFNRHHAG